MASYLSFASAWQRETKNGDEYISCSTKGEHAKIYDGTAKKSEKCPVEIIIRNQNGEEITLDKFIIVTNNNKRDGSNDPDYEIKVKVGE